METNIDNKVTSAEGVVCNEEIVKRCHIAFIHTTLSHSRVEKEKDNKVISEKSEQQ